MNKKLEAVIVCDGYGDFLHETLPFTKVVADDIVVVTSKEDSYTQRVCKKLDVRYVISYVHKYNDSFNKARAINYGLAHLELKDWWLHLDADIVLPMSYKKWFNEAHLEKNKIYGVDRFNVNYDQWQQVKKTDWLDRTREWGFLISPPSDLKITPQIKMGSRVGHADYHGWIPIGFHQLSHSSERNRYPNKQQSNMEHTDLLFASHYPPENRILVGDTFLLHLTTDSKMGVNWEGRKSKAFGNPSLMPINTNYNAC
mgnify:CR=1 FL=1